MNRFLGMLALVTSLSPIVCQSEPASDEQMATEALSNVPRDPVKRGMYFESQFEKLVEISTLAPDRIQPATVFFNKGLSYRELQELKEGFGIEVIDVGLKAPQGNKGVVMSIGAGMADLWAINGTLEERLTFLVASQQKCFAKMAKVMPANEAQEMMDLATKPFFVYSARIFRIESVTRPLATATYSKRRYLEYAV